MSRIEQIRTLLASDPADAFLNFALGMEYAKAGQPAGALAQFVRVNELDPNHVGAYAQRASMLIALERREEARSTLTEGVAVAERVGDAHMADQMRESLTLLGN